jgi:hypothetical protein
VLVVAPAALLHPVVPQPDGTVLYELLTGHPDRAAHELVLLPDITCELRAWPYGTWVTLSGPDRKFVRGPERTSGLRSYRVWGFAYPLKARSIASRDAAVGPLAAPKPGADLGGSDPR